MKRHRLTTMALSRACGVVAMTAMMLAFALPAAAQNVTAADIQRLQDQVYDVSGDVSRMRGNQDTAARVQSELDDLRDEVVYLKVKLRKEGTVRRTDLTDVQNRLQDLRSRARADVPGNNTVRSGDNPGGWRTNSDPNGAGTTGTRTGGAYGGVNGGVVTDDRTRPDQERRTPDPTATGSNNTVIPSGQEIDVRLEGELSSATAQVEQRDEIQGSSARARPALDDQLGLGLEDNLLVGPDVRTGT